MKSTLHAILVVGLLSVVTASAQGPTASASRAEMAARTEGAIVGGLRWLADNQIRGGTDAGSWPVNYANYRPAIASLAGLAFLANGHLPDDGGPYGTNVAAALKYVTGTMASDGYVGQGDRSGMYIHAISSLFVLSCLGMQADEKLEPDLADWCRRSLDVILRAQQISRATRDRGGWRYDPYTSDSDVSVTCWQLLVLHTGRQAGFEVDPSVFNTALAYLSRAYAIVPPEAGEDRNSPAGAYHYPDRRTGGHPSRSTTALVVFIQSLYDAMNEQRTAEALTYLHRFPPTWDGDQYGGFFFFSSFYMVQGMFQFGGEEWESFGPRMAKLLLDHQSGDGSWPYPPGNKLPALMQGTGPAYPAAMAVLMLSLDKQYLPMYQRQSRIYGGRASVALPTEKSDEQAVASTATKPDPEVLTIPEIVPEIVPNTTPAGNEAWNGGGYEEGGGGGWGEPDDGLDRTIGRPLFK